ncbi:MAG: AAA family ATPase [Thermomicrobiales bacterium]|nr:AAA family ATPase [Thermomicrobiales bacterium]MCO5223095.1 AAA family ATPase [Thermomicrobiales bacterium]
MTHHFEENPTNTIPWRPRELPRPASLPAARAIELFYPSLGHSDCIERLEDASRNGGLSVVVGDTGLGKSLLLDVCLDDLALRHTVVVVRDPHEVRTDTQLLKAIITQAGAKPSGRSGIAMMGDLDELVLALLRRERPLRILIDDAEQLSGSQLELIRTILSNVSPASGAIGVILFGKPALIDKVERRQALYQQLEMHHTLNPFCRKDTAGMVRHRAKELGDSPLARYHFGEEALQLIHTRARGNPSQILQAMGLSINRARTVQRSTIDAGIVLDALSSPHRAGVQQRLPFELFGSQSGESPPAPVVLFQERSGHELEGGG